MIQRADGNERSVVVQAQGDHGATVVAVVNVHEKRLLPTRPVEPAVIAAARQAWVRVDREGRRIEAAEQARDVLLRGEGVVVVAGAEGSGRFGTAVRALTMLDGVRRGRGIPPLKLCRLTPDWDPPDTALLPIRENHGYLLDVSAEIAEWPKHLGLPAGLLAHGRNLAKVGSHLVVITDRHSWPSTGETGAALVRAQPPAPRPLAISHLGLLYGQLDIAARLQPGYQVKEGEQPLADLVTDGMSPADAAELARLLSSGAASEKGLRDAIAAFTGWRTFIADFFAATVERPEDRALLLAAVLLEGAAPSQVQKAARELLGEPADDSVRKILSGLDLGSRLRQAGAKVADNKVTLAHRPGYAYAALKHVWNELAEIQAPFRKWVAKITGKGQVGAGHLGEIADLLARLAADHSDDSILPSHTTGSRNELAALSRGETAARMLSAAADHPVLGAEVRRQLRENWAPSHDQEVAKVAALVCQGVFAARYPGQALVRLQHVLAREVDDLAIAEAGKALRMLVIDYGQHAPTWAAVTDWIGSPDQEAAGRPSRARAGRRAFLALADVTTDPRPMKLLLTAAAHDPTVTDEIVAAWNTTLYDKALADRCETTLTGWAEAAAQGTLPGELVLDTVERVISKHVVNDPVAALLVGREGTSYSAAVIDFRQRLMQRRFPTGRPEST
ncbi:hypothetical protein ACFC6L_29995 [Kitasatospora phosalacinea]|uniref:hypothetical protein n=1 Tax=Kitasatospora phosalacinea TaxID=2065 RepID=UPI0035DC454A